MKIGIVGGGISGLYLAENLKDRHLVTIFEANQWGGDIQTDTVDGKCYPISTLFVMPYDDLLREEIKKRNLPLVDYEDHATYAYFITFLLAACIIAALHTGKHIFGAVILLILVLIFIYAKNKICYLTLAFGAHYNCDHTIKNIASVLSKGEFYKNLSYIPDCGMKRLYLTMLNYPSVRYINSPVTKIVRDSANNTIYYNNTYEVFDIIVMACPYQSYKDILNLTPFENKLLSNVEYFDFYSTLTKFDGEPDLTMIPGYLGHFKKDDAYLIASHSPLVIPVHLSCTFQRTYKWRMPVASDVDRNQVNMKNNRIFFTGKEIAGNGIQYCMSHVKKLIEIMDLD